MNKKVILLAASLLSIGTVTTAALLNSNYKINAMQADESCYSLTFTASSYFDTRTGSFTTYSINGGVFTTTFSNSGTHPSEDIMYSIKLNGGGIGIEEQFQSINSVTVTYAFDSANTGVTADLYLAETDEYSGETMKINYSSSDRLTATITASDPFACHFFKLWASGSTDSSDSLDIYSISVSYTCVA